VTDPWYVTPDWKGIAVYIELSLAVTVFEIEIVTADPDGGEGGGSHVPYFWTRDFNHFCELPNLQRLILAQ
jgi:hypothetical protein